MRAATLGCLALCTAAVGLSLPARLSAAGLIEQHYHESHALLIGMSRYHGEGWDPLPSVPTELARVESALRAQGFEVQTHLDLDAESLRRTLRHFANDQGFDEDNRLLVYFAGHGETEYRRHGKEMGYIVPVDAPALAVDARTFSARALSMAQIGTLADEIRAKHAMFVFDSCFSGSIFKSRGLHRSAHSTVERLLDKPVRYFITSGSADETVPAVSAFAGAFVAALQEGLGDLDGDGYITSSELGLHLTQHVNFAHQTPQHGKSNHYAYAEGDMVFLSPLGVALDENAPPPVTDRELAFWESAVALNAPPAYQAYLEQWPEGTFAALARAALAPKQAPGVVVASTGNTADLAALESSRLQLLPVRVDTQSQHWNGAWQSAEQVRQQASTRIWSLLSQRGIVASPYERSDGWQRGLFSTGVSPKVLGDGDLQGLGVHLQLGNDNMEGRLRLYFRDAEGQRKSAQYRVNSAGSIGTAMARALDELPID